MSLRVTCANSIAAVNRGKSLNEILEAALQELPEQQRALAQELIYGTLRWQIQLTWILDRLLHKPLKKNDLISRALLLMALYQLRFGRTGSHVVVSETVDTARQVGLAHQASMMNAVLRNYQRRTEEFEPQGLPDSARTAHPQWMVDRIRKDWPQHWQQILAANNQRAPMVLRINPDYRSRDAYLEALAEQGIDARHCDDSPVGIRLTRAVDVFQLPGFGSGGVSVQDEGAQLAGPLLAPVDGERVLDACAAPGGKTGHLLELADIDLVALDSSQVRLQRVHENLQRLKKSATLIAEDARDVTCWWDRRPFDRILVDAPCSATGVIRRNPDIRLLRRASDIARLAALQGEILDSLWPTLASGGTLLFATCSVMRRENERVVERFLNAHPDAEVHPMNLNAGVACSIGKQLLPTDHGHDGFYYALLGKRPANEQ